MASATREHELVRELEYPHQNRRDDALRLLKQKGIRWEIQGMRVLVTLPKNRLAEIEGGLARYSVRLVGQGKSSAHTEQQMFRCNVPGCKQTRPTLEAMQDHHSQDHAIASMPETTNAPTTIPWNADSVKADLALATIRQGTPQEPPPVKRKGGGRKGSTMVRYTPAEDALLFTTLESAPGKRGKQPAARQLHAGPLSSRSMESIIARYYALREKGYTPPAVAAAPKPAPVTRSPYDNLEPPKIPTIPPVQKLTREVSSLMVDLENIVAGAERVATHARTLLGKLRGGADFLRLFEPPAS